jgi:hypothetical protein
MQLYENYKGMFFLLKLTFQIMVSHLKKKIILIRKRYVLTEIEKKY